MTMTGSMSKRGRYGAVANIREGQFPTFLLSKSCMVHEITNNGNIVFRVTNPIDRASLIGLQNSLVVLLFRLLSPLTDGMTCHDAESMVQPVIVRDGDGVNEAILLLTCVVTDEQDSVHRPTRIHRRRRDGDIQRRIGVDQLKLGQRAYPIFHIPGASMDPSSNRLIPHITVSDVIIDQGAGDCLSEVSTTHT